MKPYIVQHAMAVRLVITEWGDPSSEYVRSFLQDRIVIGRARSSDICLPDLSVSTRHAEIRLQGRNYALVDTGSLNGTEVNGKKLIAHRPRLLTNDDNISIAGFRIRFKLGVSPGPTESKDTSLIQAREMLARILARSGDRRETNALVVVSGPSIASRFELPSPPARLTIGRGRDSDIRLEDGDVSRRHAEVVVEPEGIFVRDLGSRNGVVVDGQRVEAIRLEAGKFHFTLGTTVLGLEHPLDAPLSSIFEAPEEETSSFALCSIEADTEKPVQEAAPFESKESEASPASIPIGPADPLLASDDQLSSRTTGKVPIPPMESGSDIGLIIVGAIIVVAAVLGLVYLLG